MNRPGPGRVQPPVRHRRNQLEHRIVRRWLSDYVDDDLSPRRRRRVVRHADDCPDCGPVLRGIVHVRATLLALGRGSREQQTVVPLVLERLRRDDAVSPGGQSWDGAA